jgi:hypothetical protein
MSGIYFTATVAIVDPSSGVALGPTIWLNFDIYFGLTARQTSVESRDIRINPRVISEDHPE